MAVGTQQWAYSSGSHESIVLSTNNLNVMVASAKGLASFVSEEGADKPGIAKLLYLHLNDWTDWCAANWLRP